MEAQYFGDHCGIYGIGINPRYKNFKVEHVEIFIGDQKVQQFLRSIAEQIPRIDILIDDGGHTMQQQVATFEELFPVKHDVYLCEALHPACWHDWGGGYGKSGPSSISSTQGTRRARNGRCRILPVQRNRCISTTACR